MHKIYIQFSFKSCLIVSLLLIEVLHACAQTNLNVSACNSYTLPWNTSATVSSGVYTHTYKNIANLDSVVAINLTINVGPTAAMLSSTPSSLTYVLNEQFDNGTTANGGNTVVTYTPAGWFQTNKSSPLGSTNWFSGPFLSNGTSSFTAQSGAGCIVADYLNNGNAGTISNWLISPKVTMQNGDLLSFYTMSNPGSPYADRMEVRMNTIDTSTNVGTSATSVGSFTTTLTTINNTLASYGYPQTWTLYTVAISGLSGPTTGRIAFRYFVTSGGPNGANSDMIGLDNVTLTRTNGATICAGNSFDLKLNIFGGTSPYSVILNNSIVGNFTTNNYINGNSITQFPTANTTYSIVSVADANGCAASTKMFTAAAIVNQPITVNLAASNCTQVVLPWGVNATTSGVYSHTYVRSNGCDSIVNFNVTILPSTVALQSISACTSFQLPWGGTINTSGFYTHTYTSINGCDSVTNLNITIFPSQNNTITINACNQYVLPWNNAIVTSSGIHTHTYISSNLCDSIVNLNITIFAANSISHSAVACDSFLLPWNVKVVSSGSYSHIYTNVSGCDSTDIFNIIINTSKFSSSIDSALNNFMLPWGINVTNSGIYSHVYLTVNGCDSTVAKYVYIYPAILLPAKVILSGPYNITTNLMNDDLRLLNIVPNTEPFSSVPYSTIFTHVNGGGGEIIGSNVLNISGNNAIVDWIFLELRSPMDSTIVVATKSALLQRDGDIVSPSDGISPIAFSNNIPGNYFISIRHRNHLGVMSKNKIFLSSTTPILDFTNNSIDLFTKPSKLGNPIPFTGASRVINGVRTLYSGNININLLIKAQKLITYNTQNISDRIELLNATGGVNTINGYSIFDVDLNGFARYNGFNPDRFVVYSNCLNSNSSILSEQIP
jgi:Ni,Fe-hydrogenase III small subunit